MEYKTHNSKGFSIIETIVAIAILSFVMVAPLTLAQRSLNASIYAQDQVTAFYLAQEAIEYVRNVRDNNNLAGLSGSSNWLSGFALCTPGKAGCGIDTNAQTLIHCNNDPARCNLTFDTATGIYGEQRDSSGNPLAGWQNSIFTRSITVVTVPIGSDQNAEADLVATVSWKTGLLQKSISVNEELFDWYPPPTQ